MKFVAVLVLCFMFLVPPCSPAAIGAPEILASSSQDRRDIEALLAAYTGAVSTKDQALFETLLLSKDIPFSYVDAHTAKVAHDGTAHYESFCKDVFQGRPFTQTFKNVNIEQDGNLANVRLIFTNKDATSSSWGWKTL
jgi:hypothetical protein